MNTVTHHQVYIRYTFSLTIGAEHKGASFYHCTMGKRLVNGVIPSVMHCKEATIAVTVAPILPSSETCLLLFAPNPLHR